MSRELTCHRDFETLQPDLSDMTNQTIKFYLKNIFRKLGVDNRSATINAGSEPGLI